MNERTEMVEPPTRARMEEKWGTDRATNRAAPSVTVRDTSRFHVKPKVT